MNEADFLKLVDTQLEELKMGILYGDTKSSLIALIEDIRTGIRWQLEEEAGA